jgi:hypothetical protein
MSQQFPSVQDLYDAKTDIDDLATIVNGPDHTQVATRYGGSKPTLTTVLQNAVRDFGARRITGAHQSATQYHVNDLWQASDGSWYWVVQAYQSQSEAQDIASNAVLLYQSPLAQGSAGNVVYVDTVAELEALTLSAPALLICGERDMATYSWEPGSYTPVLGDVALASGGYARLHVSASFNAAWLGTPRGTGADAYPYFDYMENHNAIDTITCIGGTYRIDTSLEMTKHLRLKNGAVFAPAVGVAFFTTGSVNGNPGEDVVVLAGQSNALGAADQSTLDAALNRTWHNCQIFGGSNFVALGPTTNQSNSGKHGIEFELARKYAQQGRRLWLIKYAMGGTALDDNPSNDNNWLPNRGNLNRIFFEDWLRPALGKLARENIYIKFVWCQGEADSAGSNVGMARRYEQNLLEFFGQVIDAISPVQICLIRTNGNISGFVNVADVQQAQTRVSDMIPNCFWIDTDNTPLQGDNLHFTSAGYADIASRVFNVLSKKTTGLTKALNLRPWQRRLLLNPRREGVGATSFATPITSTTVDNQASTGLGVGLTLTGKSLINSYYTVAVAEITAWPGGASLEANIEVVPASGALGGVIVAGEWDGTELTGYFIRMATNEIRVFHLADSTATLLASAAIAGNTNIPMGLRVEAQHGVINLYVKTPNANWKNALAFDANLHTGSRLFITGGWGDSDETGIRFGNIRTLPPR